MDFNGKVAIVTGGSKGIGRAYTSALLRLGMKVCIADINEVAAKEYLAVLFEEHKNNVLFEQCDVTCFEQQRAVFEKVISSFGRIDMVINNAGVFNEIKWQKIIEVNFIGVVFGIKLAFEYMDKTKNGHGGHVINTASEAGFISFPVFPVYSGTKHAVVGLTKGYGDDYHFHKTGISVNAICPGPVDTDFLRGFPALTLDVDEARKLEGSIKPIKPDDVAKALLKLLADGKNGAFLRVDADGMRYEK